MKRFFIVFAMLIACVSMTMAQEKQASIRFEKITKQLQKQLDTYRKTQNIDEY